MNSRLLHAAARGARIQFSLHDNEWHTSRDIDVSKDERWPQRIHPSDTHLQYGPVSSALREIAEQPNTMNWTKDVGVPTYFGFSISMHDDEQLAFTAADTFHRSLFLLILSESLADVGL